MEKRTHTERERTKKKTTTPASTHQSNLRRALCDFFLSFNWTFNTLNVMINPVKHFIRIL